MKKELNLVIIILFICFFSNCRKNNIEVNSYEDLNTFADYPNGQLMTNLPELANF